MDPRVAAGENAAVEGEVFDAKREAILEAARRLLIRHGLRRTSLNDVARGAGVSRATLFRRFASRDALLAELIQRESQRLIATVDQQVAAAVTAEDRVAIGFLTFIKQLRGNDLLDALLESDPEQMLPLVTTDGGVVIALGRAYVASWLIRTRDEGFELTGDPEQLGEVFARIAHSLVLTPQTSLPLDDDAALMYFARSVLMPLAIRPPRC